MKYRSLLCLLTTWLLTLFCTQMNLSNVAAEQPLSTEQLRYEIRQLKEQNNLLNDELNTMQTGSLGTRPHQNNRPSESKPIYPIYKENIKDDYTTDTKKKKSNLKANDVLAVATLRSLSTALESYAASNFGSYPTDMSYVIFTTPPLINMDYCDKTISGYSYSCELSKKSYKFVATPVQLGTTGTMIVTVTTGGEMKY